MSEETHLTPEDLAELKEAFHAEALELLERYTGDVLQLERSTAPAHLLKTIQRVAHTVKGNSMSLEFDKLADLTHRLEDFLEELLAANHLVSRPQIDLLLRCGDAMSTLLESYCAGSSVDHIEIQSLNRQLEAAMAKMSVSTPGEPQGKFYQLVVTFVRKCQMRSAGAFLIRRRLETVARILDANPDPESEAIEKSAHWTLTVNSEAKPDELKQAARVPGVSSRVRLEPLAGAPTDFAPQDAVSSLRVLAPPEAASKGEADTETAEAKSASSQSTSDQLRMDVGKIDRIINLVGELVIGRSMVNQALLELSSSGGPAIDRLATANTFLERTLSELQTVVLKIRMVPVDHVFRRFPRLVRDLSHSSGKEVSLEIRGASTELDKSIADALGEPLLHLVRNSIDHGLESPEERVRRGKTPVGKLTLAASYESNQVHILLEDDGRGIDVEAVRRRAVALGLAGREEIDTLPHEELLNFLYRPGFSTREAVSTVSGRGVGMDVVRKTIETLKGTIEVQTVAGFGTRFLIRLPLTLAILRAIMIEAAGRTFALPLSGVLEIVRLYPKEAESILGGSVLTLRDRVVPLVDLREVLNLESGAPDGHDRVFVILAGEAERRIGLIVDKLIGEHELVVKPLEDPLIQNPAIAGASILGDGRVVLILNLRGLMSRRRVVREGVDVIP